MKKSLCVLVSVWAEWNEKKICVRRWEDTQTHTHVHTTERRRQSYTRCESLRWRKREKERQTKQIRMWWHRCEWEKCVYVCSKCQNRIERARATKPYNTITQLANKYYDVYTFDSSLLRLRCRERVTRVCSPNWPYSQLIYVDICCLHIQLVELTWKECCHFEILNCQPRNELKEQMKRIFRFRFCCLFFVLNQIWHVFLYLLQ